MTEVCNSAPSVQFSGAAQPQQQRGNHQGTVPVYTPPPIFLAGDTLVRAGQNLDVLFPR